MKNHRESFETSGLIPNFRKQFRISQKQQLKFFVFFLNKKSDFLSCKMSTRQASHAGSWYTSNRKLNLSIQVKKKPQKILSQFLKIFNVYEEKKTIFTATLPPSLVGVIYHPCINMLSSVAFATAKVFCFARHTNFIQFLKNISRH